MDGGRAGRERVRCSSELAGLLRKNEVRGLAGEENVAEELWLVWLRDRDGRRWGGGGEIRIMTCG